MPAPPRTSLGDIRRAGRGILESEGLDALTMHRVAAVVGIRAPSLYKHVRDRAALVRLIATDIEGELGALLQASTTTGDPRTDLEAIADTFRRYAHEHPAAYTILFSHLPEDWRLAPDLSAGAFDALFRTIEAVAGPEQRLEAARTVVAWAHGFVSMELAGAFRLGGDVDAAFAYGIEHLGEAIARPKHVEPGR